MGGSRGWPVSFAPSLAHMAPEDLLGWEGKMSHLILQEPREEDLCCELCVQSGPSHGSTTTEPACQQPQVGMAVCHKTGCSDCEI